MIVRGCVWGFCYVDCVMLNSLFFVSAFLLLIIVVIVGVAFLNLFECRILGYFHISAGPNNDQYFHS